MANTAEERAAIWLGGRSLASWRDEFDRNGYLIFERVLPQERSLKSAPLCTENLIRL